MYGRTDEMTGGQELLNPSNSRCENSIRILSRIPSMVFYNYTQYNGIFLWYGTTIRLIIISTPSLIPSLVGIEIAKWSTTFYYSDSYQNIWRKPKIWQIEIHEKDCSINIMVIFCWSPLLYLALLRVLSTLALISSNF